MPVLAWWFYPAVPRRPSDRRPAYGCLCRVRIDLAAGVLVERLAAFGVGFNARAPIVLMLLRSWRTPAGCRRFLPREGAAAVDLGALQMQRVIAFAAADRVTLPSEASVAPRRSVADSFTLAMSNAPPAERLPPVFSLLSSCRRPDRDCRTVGFLARLGRFRRLQRDLAARAQGDVAPLLTSVPLSVRSRPAFSSTPCWPLTLPTRAVLPLFSPLRVPPPKPAPKFLLSAVKPPFAEALTLKTAVVFAYRWPDRSEYRRRR